MPLPDDTLLYPGHDYMKNNLAFALTREPSNNDASKWQSNVADTQPDDMPVMTMGQERLYNPFLRLHHPAVIDGLKSGVSASGIKRPRCIQSAEKASGSVVKRVEVLSH